LEILESQYGINLTEGATILRLAISNLLSSPPTAENLQKLIIACKDDETFARFLKGIVGEPVVV
jgi:hypothetical protein